MVKKKRASYLSPSSLLTKKEYQDYKMSRKITARDKLQGQIEERKKGLKEYFKERRYKESGTGRTSSKIGGFLRGLQRVSRKGVTRSLYERKSPPLPSQRTSGTIRTRRGVSSGRGRPKGSYDSRYAKYGGVYGYRKAMSQQRWRERQAVLERSAVNPRQQAVLRQIQQRDAIARQSPERKVIPDTSGNVPMKNIMDEINRASNLVS